MMLFVMVRTAILYKWVVYPVLTLVLWKVIVWIFKIIIIRWVGNWCHQRLVEAPQKYKSQNFKLSIHGHTASKPQNDMKLYWNVTTEIKYKLVDPVPRVNVCPGSFCCCFKLDNSYQNLILKNAEIFWVNQQGAIEKQLDRSRWTGIPEPEVLLQEQGQQTVALYLIV